MKWGSLMGMEKINSPQVEEVSQDMLFLNGKNW